MNSFYQFKTAVELKERNKAMLILRDKTESVARRIMEKAKIDVPDYYKGRLFWQWVQNFIIRACQSEENNASLDTSRSIVRITDTSLADPQSRGSRCGEAHRADHHAYRSWGRLRKRKIKHAKPVAAAVAA